MVIACAVSFEGKEHVGGVCQVEFFENVFITVLGRDDDVVLQQTMLVALIKLLIERFRGVFNDEQMEGHN